MGFFVTTRRCASGLFRDRIRPERRKNMKYGRCSLLILSVCVFSIFPIPPCASQSGGKAVDLTVIYVDGVVESSIAPSWKALALGDAVSPDATIRVSKAGSIQLARAGVTLSFFNPGSYSVADILLKNVKASATGLVSALGKTARALVVSNQKAPKGGSVGGVRAGSTDKISGTIWVDELEDIRIKIRALFAEEKYAEAVDILTNAKEEGLTEVENEEVSFLLASASYSLGETARAWKAIEEQKPDPSSKFFADIFLLKSQLLMEGYYFPEALDVLRNLTGSPMNPQTTQQAWFLIGMCRRMQGDETAARDAWSKGIAIAPGSETANWIAETMNVK
jgi:hypothetical protein